MAAAAASAAAAVMAAMASWRRGVAAGGIEAAWRKWLLFVAWRRNMFANVALAISASWQHQHHRRMALASPAPAK